MFASDRDLLVLEPELFRDVGWVGQRLVKGTGDVSGNTLTLTAQDNTFAAAGVAAGNVVLVDSVPYEVIARLTATTATISRIRPDPDAAVLPPAAVTGKVVLVPTFAPQIAQTHREILRLLGIDPYESGGGVTEADITNPKAFREAEAMGALALVLFGSGSSAVAVDITASARINRSRWYQEQHANALRRAGALIDTDGDGVPNATRRVGFAIPVRG